MSRVFSSLQRFLTLFPPAAGTARGWACWPMCGAIAKNGSFFNSHRMVRRYVLDAYSR